MACEAIASKGVEVKVDTTRQKEAVLKERIQPWIDEAFIITADIEGKLAQMKAMHALRQGVAPESESSAERVEQIQQTVDQCAADLRVAKEQLEGLHDKIVAPAK